MNRAAPYPSWGHVFVGRPAGTHPDILSALVSLDEEAYLDRARDSAPLRVRAPSRPGEYLFSES